jgi:hypothetical protein
MAIVQDDFSPIYTGDTGAPFAPQFLHKDNTPVNLTGATITMKMQLVASPGAIGETSGTIIICTTNSPSNWIIDDAVNGKAHRQWDAADVATPGTWNLYIVIAIGGLPIHSDVKQLVILSGV